MYTLEKSGKLLRKLDSIYHDTRGLYIIDIEHVLESERSFRSNRKLANLRNRKITRKEEHIVSFK